MGALLALLGLGIIAWRSYEENKSTAQPTAKQNEEQPEFLRPIRWDASGCVVGRGPNGELLIPACQPAPIFNLNENNPPVDGVAQPVPGLRF